MAANRIKKSWLELRDGVPGQRFQDFRARRRKQRSRTSVVLRLVLGVALVIAGLLLSLPPLVPGFVVTAAGLALIAAQSCRVAGALDAIECRIWALLPRRHRAQFEQRSACRTSSSSDEPPAP